MRSRKKIQKGAHARTAKTIPEQRREIAKKAAKARWAKNRQGRKVKKSQQGDNLLGWR
jgi:hypothetical protein